MPEEELPAAQAADSAATDTDTTEVFDEARAKSLITKLRGEIKDGKATAKELESAKAKLAEIERSQMSEVDRIKADAQDKGEKLTTAQATLRQERIERSIERTSRTLNIVDEDAAVRLLDHSKIEFDDQGKPTNIDTLLKSLVEAKPYLVSAAAPATAGNPANPARPASASGTFTTSQIADRTFYLANKEAIERANREGRIVQG